MEKARKKRKKLPPEEFFDSPNLYYAGERLYDYTHSKSMMRIQERITKRALELIGNPENNCLILDCGCGCGFSASYLFLNKYTIIGVDLIFEMLVEYDIRELNPINSDMKFLPFRSKSFDFIISISAFQWIINKMEPVMRLEILKRLALNFNFLLKEKGKAIIQFYPINEGALREIGKIFADHGNFSGNFIIDNPKSAAKRKTFLYLEKNMD